MSKKLYAVVLDNNMVVADLIHGGLAIYENLKDAKIRLEQIYHINKRNMLKQGIKHVVKKRFSIKEYVLNDPKQDLKWQKLKKIITGLYAKAEFGNVESCVTRYIVNKMQELEGEDG